MEVVKKARLRINALETLNELKRRGYEIIIITARSDKYYSDPYQISYDYLVQKKIPFDKLIVNKVYREQQIVAIDKLDFKIIDSYVSNKNINGNVINKNKEFSTKFYTVGDGISISRKN